LLCLAVSGILALCAGASWGQQLGQDTELLRQQERERFQREQREATPDVRLPRAGDSGFTLIPDGESPCFAIHEIRLKGEGARRFAWALRAAEPSADPATGRCLGTAGVNVVMTRIQNAILERGYVTTRILAAPQDFKTGVLELTVIPGRVRSVRFAFGTDSQPALENAVPINPGDILNLRDIEQALENLKRLPTVETDIQITPAQGPDARLGESDLVIVWKQARRYRLNVALDDSGSERTGKRQGAATLSFDNLLTVNDLFYAHVNHSVLNSGGKGTKGYAFHYSVPLGYWLLSATAGGYEYRQNIAGFMQSYDYSGNSANGELRLSRVVYRDASRKTGAHIRAWTRQSRNFIDDTEVKVQHRRMGGWEAGISHLEYIGTAVLDANLAYLWGTGAFGAIAAPEEAFGEGTSRSRIVNADARLAAPFTLAGQRLRYLAGWRAQWNRSLLVPQDQMAIGGRYTVRGFDGEIMLLGERGWVWRNDLGVQVGDGLELYAGLDVGQVSGPTARRLPGRRLVGGVAGLRGGHGGFVWDMFVGTPLHKPETIETQSAIAGFNLNWSY